MTPVRVVAGIAAPMLAPNIDTEVIIRVNRLMEFGRGELAPYAFEALRTLPDGSDDPSFILNRAPFRSARILVAGENFGCGSSREGAVWALSDAGIGCIIAPSFSDIFASNCRQNGVPAVVLPADQVDAIVAEIDLTDPAPMRVDIEARAITTPRGRLIPFQIEAEHRRMLLEGMDETGATLQLEDAIAAFQSSQRAGAPWLDPPKDIVL